ncbi:hypothetical protein HIM_00722 [Hirsutella minnesotensis 3608]|nr:hypothetical protein HIM_00722 [Hirsutella minnesotensis 3608]
MFWPQLRELIFACLDIQSTEADHPGSQAGKDEKLVSFTADSQPPTYGPRPARRIGRRHRPRAMEEIPEPDAELTAACRCIVLNVFPKVCHQHVDSLALEFNYDADAVINHMVDQEESGIAYPRLKTVDNKRKRSEDDDQSRILERARRRINDAADRSREPSKCQIDVMRLLMQADFPTVPPMVIEASLDGAHNQLLPAYLAIYQKKAETSGHLWVQKTPDALLKKGSPADLDPSGQILAELQDARRMVELRMQNRRAEMQREETELKNLRSAQATGLIRECECCCVEVALNRMAQCSASKVHWFCFDCCRRQAETLVGLSKYELTCMSTEGCESGFTHSERRKFLDEKLFSALDRIEQETVLQLANLDGLVSCPFCPFAAECSPVEVDREFRCQNPQCQITSCRLCRRETHVPNSCEEAAREQGYSARRVIEEAMSTAVIRRCNKCSTPFIREDGCNKMTCSRSSCRNVQCYVCSKSCDYTHFNDVARGGKAGNCPLFDNAEQRHAQETKRAEETARKKVTEVNPGIDPKHLEFHLSQRVKEDERRRADAVKPTRRPVPRRPVVFEAGRRVVVQPEQVAEMAERLRQRQQQRRELRMVRDYEMKRRLALEQGLPNQMEPWAPEQLGEARPEDKQAPRNDGELLEAQRGAAEAAAQARAVAPENEAAQPPRRRGRRPGASYDPAALTWLQPPRAAPHANAMIINNMDAGVAQLPGPQGPHPAINAPMQPQMARPVVRTYPRLVDIVRPPQLSPFAAVFSPYEHQYVVPAQLHPPGMIPDRGAGWPMRREAQAAGMPSLAQNQQPGSVAQVRQPHGAFAVGHNGAQANNKRP